MQKVNGTALTVKMKMVKVVSLVVLALDVPHSFLLKMTKVMLMFGDSLKQKKIY